MLSFISAALGLILALQAQGHAIITPALGGGTTRDDVQRPSASAPCGAHVDIASLIGQSQVVPITNGQIDVTATNFNTGVDGSRQVTAQIDPTGTGNSFQDATVITNGDENPTNVGSQPIVVQVPAGLPTTGTMLASFVTAGGFGNCVVVSAGTSGTTNTTTTAAGTATGTTTGTTTGGGRRGGRGGAKAGAGAGAKGAGAAGRNKAAQKNKIRNSRIAIAEAN